MADDQRAILSLRQGLKRLHGLLVPLEHLGTLDQVMRRISADAQLRRQKKTGLLGAGPFISDFDFGDVCVKRTDDRIDLR